MALFKSKGKHAQGKHASQPENITSEEGESTEPAEEGQAEAEQAEESAPAQPVVPAMTGKVPAVPKPAVATVPAVPVPEVKASSDSAIRIEDYVGEQAVSATAATAGAAATATAAAYVPSQFDAPMPAPEGTGGFAPVTIDGVTLHKKRRVGKVLGITFGSIIGVLLIAYIAGAIVFMGRFFPNTTIAGHDISMMSNEDVAALIDKEVDGYKLDIVGNGFTYHVTGAEIDLKADSAKIVDAMHADLSAWTWPAILIGQEAHDETAMIEVTYKKQNYDAGLVNAVRTFNKDATPPTDATIAYDEKVKVFTIRDEIPGTQYDSHAILAAMEEAFATLSPNIKLTGDHLIQPSVFSTDERLNTSAELATGLVKAHVTLTMGGQTVSDIDGSVLSQFIKLDDQMMVTLDDAALDKWVTDLANGFDTVGTERTYTRADGKVITVKGGKYGWSTDAPQLKEQVVAAIKAGETTTIDIPCERTAAVYNGPGQRDWGNRYIDVDISEQYVRFYGDDGSIIWESACITGSPDGKHNTWPGVWYITNKESPSKLIGYTDSGQKEYETTVAFWMAFEGNGIGLHDATWQPSFGGSMYANGYGSHGCVNLPYSAAQSLYSICAVGDVVVAHS